ncbi:hypothetical protein VP01_850g3 [Puccinia sorghi]|uniref:Major facilitator superfamily (MFS) profile domain-containing protein n=1 Tax=Puccinia sorghi TaxID=27349 RepID=A0A0L6U985_9BASI|nr:hypothetical protein VP01_850g3 [Puccinia sorghi]
MTTGEKQLVMGDLQVEKSDQAHAAKLVQPAFDAELQRIAELSAKLDNPLSGFSAHELVQQAEQFCQAHGLNDQLENFKRGAVLAANPQDLVRIPGITEEERHFIDWESSRRWKQPMLIYFVAVISSMAAIVQGMDEAVVNGAQIFYYDRFGIPSNGTKRRALIQGLVNSAPYLCCVSQSSAVFACWITGPMNRLLGRRGVIFWSCVISGAASIWEAFTYSWPQLFISRLALGLGIGPNSATAPIYTGERREAPMPSLITLLIFRFCPIQPSARLPPSEAPSSCSGKLYVGFGIALGDVVSVIFVDLDPNVSWRLMLGSTVVAPFILCCMLYYAPESPRWYMSKGRVADAYHAMRKLRFCDLQASRDLFYIAKLLEIENESIQGRNLLTDMWRVPRVRRAAQASGLVMFMQQFCGVNVIAYYSSQVFIEAGFGRKAALLTTMGTGLVNWIFAIPAMYTIDIFGRRNLLLTTFPAMAVCLLVTGMAFFIPVDGPDDHRRPVPFTYSAEAFPLYIRDFGMSYATAVCWFFNFVLAITFPLMLTAFQPQGAFGWYGKLIITKRVLLFTGRSDSASIPFHEKTAGWCIIGWVTIFFTLPETKALTLEELDFGSSTSLLPLLGPNRETRLLSSQELNVVSQEICPQETGETFAPFVSPPPSLPFVFL